MKKAFKIFWILLVVIILSSCATSKNKDTVLNNSKEYVRKDIRANITSFEKAGHAVLNLTISELFSNGFELGDSVNIDFSNGYKLHGVPLFDGYYVKKGEAILRAYPGHKFAAVCINYGKISEVGNLKIGNSCIISINTKGKYLREQSLNSLSYSNDRNVYESDETFANFRQIKMGSIAKGKLYRSSSPIDNATNRASYVDRIIQGLRIEQALNLADTRDEVNKHTEADYFNSPYYIRMFDTGKVINMPLTNDYVSKDFKTNLAKGLIQLTKKANPTPLLIHSTEGKDRTGFLAALIEMLMGAQYSEIVDDYMLSYKNFYNITKETDNAKYTMIVVNNIDEMLKVIVGRSDVKNMTPEDLKSSAVNYLQSCGMDDTQIEQLIKIFQ